MKRESMTLLVGIDFSEQSERALARAVEMAVRLQACLRVVHVRDLSAITAPGEFVATPVLAAMIERFNEETLRARNDCAALCERIVMERVEVTVHVVTGPVIDCMLAAIKAFNPDFVIVGSHGRGALKRLLLGSVSTALCQRSPVPVIVVPPAEKVERAEAPTEPLVLVPAEQAPAPLSRMASSCLDCGHILTEQIEPQSRCIQCGAEPARWYTVPITDGPADALEPAVGEPIAESLPTQQTNDPAGLFSTAPAGVSGYDVNPELRVRY